MKRNSSKSENQLYIQRYLTIVLSLGVLMIVFLCVANLGHVTARLKSQQSSPEKRSLDAFSSMDAAQRSALCSETGPKPVFGNHVPTVILYDAEGSSDALTLQLEMSGQSYRRITGLGDADSGCDLLIVNSRQVSRSDTDCLTAMVKNGTSLLFIGLPDSASLRNASLSELLGVASVAGETVFPGIRVSGELLTGKLIEEEDYPFTAQLLTLLGTNKIYASALPENYREISNSDLPPLIWRHYSEAGSGRVYVYNGSYTERELGFGLLPVVLCELQDSYIYPVINAYCVTVSGYPYTDNQTEELWYRLYSRDKQQIQMDLLSTQLKRYSKVYDARITCFSPDYEIFLTTEEKAFQYYLDEISSMDALLSGESGDGFYLDRESTAVRIEDWRAGFEFFRSSDASVGLPILFQSRVEDVSPSAYPIAGAAAALGFYSVNLDFDDILNYRGENDFWTDYCKEQEVMLGTQLRDYPYLERLNAKEALGRILMLRELTFEISYEDDCIRLHVENFDSQAWLMLRTFHENVEIDHGSVEEIGNNCYFVTLKDADAVIRWEDR